MSDRTKEHGRTALEAPGRADAAQRPHQQAEIQRAGMYQHALEDVAVTSEMDAPHPAGFREITQTVAPVVRLVGEAAVCLAQPECADGCDRQGREPRGASSNGGRPRSGSEM